MCPIDDGVIKYDRGQFKKCDPLDTSEYLELEKWRHTLYQIKLIGEYLPEKIGYGNLSQKKDYTKHQQSHCCQFVITGTQTGGLERLDGQTYTRVLDYDLEKLLIKVKGPVEASSEALTHAAIYEANKNIAAVFHIHNKAIWEGMIHNDYLATPKETPYGTKEMAQAVTNLMGDLHRGTIVMKGHEDGVIAFGRNLNEAGEEILKIYDKFGG